MGYGAEMFGPLPTSFIIQLGDHSLQCLVDTFNCAIRLWVIWQCAEFLDVQVDAHLVQDGITELGPLVGQ